METTDKTGHIQQEQNITQQHSVLATLSAHTTSQLSSLLSWSGQVCKKHLTKLRSSTYNATIGHFYTKEIARHVLVELSDNSTILDVGIGTCYAYSENSDLIKRKNIKIVGVDTDPEYIRSGKHAIIDADLESNISLVLSDVYNVPETSVRSNTFDYVIFSDSYAVIPNVHDMISFCEKFLKPTGEMIVTSTLFDKFSTNINWIKQKIVYVSSVEFGKMMLKEDLEKYIKTRCSGSINNCFRMIDDKWIPGSDCRMKTYIVKWRPDSITDKK